MDYGTLRQAIERELRREHGPDWRVRSSRRLTPAGEIAAWNAELERIHAAAERVGYRRRIQLARYHRRKLEELGA